MYKSACLLLANVFAATSLSFGEDSSAPFKNGEVETIRGYFEANIGYSSGYTGCVIASPSSDNPDYLYHWQRDAAISMHTLQYTAPNTSTFDQPFQNYIQWVTKVQSDSDPNGIDVLGEPKFYVDGSVYDQGWCRPQNDGPASRATALIEYTFWLLSEGGKTDYINKYLYSNSGESGAIPTDLNYVSEHWGDTNNCDLWEEQEGLHWYTLMVQRNALLYGSSLASKMGDNDIASNWNNTANSMISTIKSFETNGIISEQTRTLDCSIIVGSLYGGYYDLYSPTDSTVLNTMSSIQSFWYNAISQNQDGLPGIIIGRYENDVYTGCSSDGGSTAHGWILCTNAMGDIYYRNAQALALIGKNKNKYKSENLLISNGINGDKLKIYSKILKLHFPKYSEILYSKISNKWDNNEYTLNEKYEIILNLSKYMTTTGDDQLTRIHYHIQGCNFHMSEQLCETNGYEVGAYDLTWSYGTFLSAWYYRSQAIDAGAIPMPREITIDWKKYFTGFDQNFCGRCTDQCGD